jgi:Zn-finger nucleic acid-binding protein
MDAFNSCPHCNVKLHAFYVEGADGKELLEVDGCRKCGGVWFDRGELERIVAHPLELQWQEGKSYRLCARCRNPMKPWKSKKQGVAVEQCDSCRGIFLDAKELEQLGAADAERAAKESLAPPGLFQCLKCQERFPMSQGNAMGFGLVCRSCVPMPGDELLDKFVPANNQLTFDEERRQPLGSRGFFWGVLEILDVFL